MSALAGNRMPRSSTPVMVKIRSLNFTVAPIALRVGVEPRAPEGVGDHDGRRPAGLLLLVGQQPPDGRARAQRLEEPGRDPEHGDVVGRAAHGHARFAARVVGHRLEAPALRLPVVEVGRRDGGRAEPGFRPQVPHSDDAVRALERQRPQDDRVHDAEDRGGGSDPQRQRDDGGEREAGTADEAAERRTGDPGRVFPCPFDGLRRRGVAADRSTCRARLTRDDNASEPA